MYLPKCDDNLLKRKHCEIWISDHAWYSLSRFDLLRKFELLILYIIGKRGIRESAYLFRSFKEQRRVF